MQLNSMRHMKLQSRVFTIFSSQNRAGYDLSELFLQQVTCLIFILKSEYKTMPVYPKQINNNEFTYINFGFQFLNHFNCLVNLTCLLYFLFFGLNCL